MELNHRGVKMELADTDPRVRVIETLLFGEPLPPPLPIPGAMKSTPVVTAPPVAEVPLELRRFWQSLRPLEQRELLLLRQRTWYPDELEKTLGVSKNALAGLHSRMARLAGRGRVALRVSSRGKARRWRRYGLTAASAALVDQLVAAGLATPL